MHVTYRDSRHVYGCIVVFDCPALNTSSVKHIIAHWSNICSSTELPDQITCSMHILKLHQSQKVSGSRSCRACLHHNCNKNPIKLCRTADNSGRLCHLIHIWTATHVCCAGSIQYVRVPPIVRTATPGRIVRSHAQDSKTVNYRSKPLKALGRTSKRKAHRTRCSLARKARPTRNTQRAGTRVPQETGGRTSNFPAPPTELIQPHAQAAQHWQHQALTDPGLLQGMLPEMLAYSCCLSSPTNSGFTMPLHACAQDFLPKSPVCIA